MRSARDWGGCHSPAGPTRAARGRSPGHTHAQSRYVPAPERFFSPLLNCSPVCRVRLCVPVIPSGSGGTLRMAEVNSDQTVQGRRGQAGGAAAGDRCFSSGHACPRPALPRGARGRPPVSAFSAAVCGAPVPGGTRGVRLGCVSPGGRCGFGSGCPRHPRPPRRTRARGRAEISAFLSNPRGFLTALHPTLVFTVS